MSATPSQMKILIDFMEDHPEIAKGFAPKSSQGKREINMLWEDLDGKLNAEGLPTKNVTAWRKVWTDFKYRSKKKLSNNILSMKKTGGGPSEEIPISDIEEKVIELTSLRAAVTGSSSNCFGAPQIVNTQPKYEENHLIGEETLREMLESPVEFVSNEQKRSPPLSTQYSCPSGSKRLRKNENTDPTALLKEQIANDKQFQVNLIKVLTDRNQQEMGFQDRVITLLETTVEYLKKMNT